MRTMHLATAVVLALFILIPLGASSQNKVRVPPYTGANYLNDFINGDTLATGQRRDSTCVYVLSRGGLYVANTAIRNIGWTLRIIANRYGTTVYNLQVLNPQIYNSNWIYAGQVIRVY